MCFSFYEKIDLLFVMSCVYRDMRFGTWNVRVGSLKAAARELARYKLDLVSVQEVSGKKGAL